LLAKSLYQPGWQVLMPNELLKQSSARCFEPGAAGVSSPMQLAEFAQGRP
jgi:hypothetical protein